jgi:hypothetical protein
MRNNSYNMLDIVIPLKGKSSWGDNNELKYFLRSLEKNLHLDYRVKLYTRGHVGWANNKLSIEDVPPYYPEGFSKKHGGQKHFQTYFDVLNKLRVISGDSSLGDNVLYCYDDVLLLKGVDDTGVFNRRIAMMDSLQAKEIYSLNLTKWGRTVQRSLKLLKKANRPLWDYETHLPRYFNRELLREMFRDYPPEGGIVPYSPSTLYFNLFYDFPHEVICEENKIKAGFYGTRTDNLKKFADYPHGEISQIEKAVKGKLWLNYNNNGLGSFKTGTIGIRSALPGWIQNKFPLKSKFEK